MDDRHIQVSYKRLVANRAHEYGFAFEANWNKGGNFKHQITRRTLYSMLNKVIISL